MVSIDKEKNQSEGSREAYRKKVVHNVHETQYHVGHIVKAVDVGRAEKNACNDVVSKHLVMIFASFLHVDDEDLLDQKGQLHEKIPLHQARQGASRPFRPNSGKVEPIVRIAPNVLRNHICQSSDFSSYPQQYSPDLRPK